jgi:hypothetical protein
MLNRDEIVFALGTLTHAYKDLARPSLFTLFFHGSGKVVSTSLTTREI